MAACNRSEAVAALIVFIVSDSYEELVVGAGKLANATALLNQLFSNRSTEVILLCLPL